MDSYDLEVAFQKHLEGLSFSGRTLLEDEVFDFAKNGGVAKVRRAVLMRVGEEFAGFGNGRNSRELYMLQIDIWVSRTTEDAKKALKNLSDAHLAHFYPANGRGLTITENATSAHVTKRPAQRYLGREAAFLREMVEVDAYVEIPAVG